MLVYKRAMEVLAEGRMPIILPVDDEGTVMLFEIIPGPALGHPDQQVRERGHVIIASRCAAKMAYDRDE